LNIRPAELRDVPRFLELDRTSPEAAHWAEATYREAIAPQAGAPERLFLVAEDPASSEGPKESHVAGFLVAHHLAPEWELENIVVAPGARRRGIGRQLLQALLDRARETNTDGVFLEVRESNAAARKLYERAGFRHSGRRRSYYQNPSEDAILYRFCPL